MRVTLFFKVNFVIPASLLLVFLSPLPKLENATATECRYYRSETSQPLPASSCVVLGETSNNMEFHMTFPGEKSGNWNCDLSTQGSSHTATSNLAVCNGKLGNMTMTSSNRNRVLSFHLDSGERMIVNMPTS